MKAKLGNPLRCFENDKCALNEEILSLYSLSVNDLADYKYIGHTAD